MCQVQIVYHHDGKEDTYFNYVPIPPAEGNLVQIFDDDGKILAAGLVGFVHWTIYKTNSIVFVHINCEEWRTQLLIPD